MFPKNLFFDSQKAVPMVNQGGLFVSARFLPGAARENACKININEY